jgi:four helix bundle protein
MGNKKPIKTYKDLVIYQNLYKAMKIALLEIIPSLPKEEKYDLVSQMRRACKAPPALLAEGFAKRYQKRQWKKYLDDVLGECYEMINHLTVCMDIYHKFVSKEKCKEVIDTYEVSCKQLTKLKQIWTNYHENK